MGLGRNLLFSGVAMALPTALVMAVAVGPAGAGTPAYVGSAHGTISCTIINAKVKLSPPLTNSSGGTDVSFKGKLSGCTVSGSGDTITSGKVSGTISNPNSSGCTGLASGIQTPINLDIKWKGKHNGGKAKFDDSMVTIGGADAAVEGSTNDVGFSLPAAGNSGIQVTDSFAGSSNVPDWTPTTARRR